MYRLADIFISIIALTVSIPILSISIGLIYFSDLRNPIYLSKRIGLNGNSFKVLKLRTMNVGADQNKVDTTVNGDPRITRIGMPLRKWKIDELPQFLNVLLGHMSVVGPRPNVPREVEQYTVRERQLLSVKPGITDIASVAFSDLGKILENSKNPNLDYTKLIRPTKSELALIYVTNKSLLLYINIVWLTALSLISHKFARKYLEKLTNRYGSNAHVTLLRRHEIG